MDQLMKTSLKEQSQNKMAAPHTSQVDELWPIREKSDGMRGKFVPVTGILYGRLPIRWMICWQHADYCKICHRMQLVGRRK